MAGRALIIAIEHYPDSVDLAKQIVGATTTAEQFFVWVTTTKKIAPKDTYVCVNGGTFPDANLFSTARESIVDAIAQLVTAGADQTDELYVFFSGHGYCRQESIATRPVDVLVAGDFVSAAVSGTKCIQLQEVQAKLFGILGGRHHYYFVDACRTQDDDVEPIVLGRKLGRPAQRGRPTKYTFYSTAFGRPAAIASEFSPVLIEGLHGKGRAKGMTDTNTVWVQFPLLCTYVQQRVQTQKMDRIQEGDGQGLILQLDPVPTYTCRIEVQGAAPTDAFEARLGPAGMPAFQQITAFTGGTCALTFKPANLELGVFQAGVPLKRTDPPESRPLDFFDDCAAVFLKPAQTRGLDLEKGGNLEEVSERALAFEAPTRPRTTVWVTAAAGPDLRTQAVNLNTGAVEDLTADTPKELPAGEYMVTVRDRGMAIDQSVRTIKPGAAVQLPGAEPLGPARESIVRAVGGDPARGTVAFSETLGEIGNRDLGLWLSLMGASHILADPGTFSKLRELKLDDVTAHPPNSTAVYVLAATADDAPVTVTVGDQTQTARPVPQLTRVVQSTHPATAGPQLVTIKSGNNEARTLASYCLPNRLTFIVMSPGSRGQSRVNQFMLPMFHLNAFQPPIVQRRIQEDSTPLRTIRTAYLFQAQFARSREIAPTESDDQTLWRELLLGKWLDPVMSLLACYEILRRGRDHHKQDLRTVVIPNLETWFPGLPDTAAIATMLDLPRPEPTGPPLFREGLLAFEDWDEHLPIPADRLDFAHIWTMWRGRRR